MCTPWRACIRLSGLVPASVHFCLFPPVGLRVRAFGACDVVLGRRHTYTHLILMHTVCLIGDTGVCGRGKHVAALPYA